MQGEATAILTVLVCLSAVGVLVEADENIKANSSESSVRQSASLCAGEQEHVDKRKKIVLESLNSLGINCTTDNVPHIALLASGGAQRSAVALLGALHQMEEDGLLDTLLYFGGVSGSTWTMSFLYSDPEWSTNMSASLSRFFTSELSLAQSLAWLGQKVADEHFSLSSIWGVMISAGLMNQLDVRHLSGDVDRNATNPYPVYGAIERHCFKNGTIEGQWFELTPQEAGFPELGLFVETCLLGSRFKDGELLQKRSEIDMVELQGVLGSTMAEEIGALPTWMQILPEVLDVAAKEYLRAYNARSDIEDPPAVSAMGILRAALYDRIQHGAYAPWMSMTPEEKNHKFQQWRAELRRAAEVWIQNLEDGPFKMQVSVLIGKILPLIEKWEWGTTANFLYKYNDTVVPSCLQSQENLNLIDGGLLLNTPFPSFLGEKREIDLIIAPEYSSFEVFEILTLTRNYSAALGKPFPAIDDKMLEEREWPKDCYVLEGKDREPTIVYLPLFNQQNCKDAEEVKARMEEFSAYQPPFSQQKIDFLLATAKANMLNNRETLLREMNKAALRKQSRKRAEEELGAKSVKV